MATVIFLLFCVLWYVRPLLTQGKGNKLPAKYYINTILIATVPGLAVILIIEIGFGWIFKWTGIDTKTNFFWMFVENFIVIAGSEEFTKYMCGRLYINKLVRPRRADYIFLFGSAGLGYEIIESFMMLSSPLSAIARGAMCVHIMWQYIMGEYLFRAYTAQQEGDEKKASNNRFKAFFFPIALHGLNDFLIAVFSYYQPAIQNLSESSDAFPVIMGAGSLILLIAELVFSMIWGYRLAMGAAREVRDAGVPAQITADAGKEIIASDKKTGIEENTEKED